MSNPTTDAAREASPVVAAFIAPNTSLWQGALVNVCADGTWWARPASLAPDAPWELQAGPLAAVSRARDEAWREAVEALKVNHRDGCEKCRPDGECVNEGRAVFGNAALDTLLARMDGAK